jgi:MFS family permease
MYMIGLPLLCLASFALGFSRTIPQLMVFRFFQALGAAPGLSVGKCRLLCLSKFCFIDPLLRRWSDCRHLCAGKERHGHGDFLWG